MIALFAAAAVATAAPQSAAAQMDALNHMYQQSCSVKAYGSYDDICSGLRKQMKEAQKRLKKEARAEASAPPPKSQPASEPTAQALGFAPTKN